MKSSQPEYIAIGRILAPWRTEGKVKVEVTTDFPRRFAPSSQVYINHQPATIDSTEWQKGKAIVKLHTINSIEEAKKLTGRLIEIRRFQLDLLPAGQYYHFQLIGLEVRTTQGELLGKIIDVLPTPSNDNYVVRGNKEEILIPAIEDVIKSIDLNKGCLIIEPIEGLLNLNKKAAK